MSEKCYLCGSTDGKCNHFPTPPASHDAGDFIDKAAAGIPADVMLTARAEQAEEELRCADQTIATLTAEVARLTGELDAASARLHEVATLCATVEQERDRLTGELADARNALDDAADEVANWGAYADEYFQQKHDLVGAVEKLRALAKGKSSITTADQLRAELERSRQECARLRECALDYLDCLGYIDNGKKLAKDLAALSQPGKGG